jgi:hypothetical protein
MPVLWTIRMAARIRADYRQARPVGQAKSKHSELGNKAVRAEGVRVAPSLETDINPDATPAFSKEW